MIDVVDQNALLIQIVQQHLFVEMRNVLTLVNVHRMLIVLRGIIEEYVNADLDIRVIHMESPVHLVRYIIF